MRLTRIHLPEPVAGRRRLRLPEDATTHLTRVLRLGPGAPLRVFDGSGGEYDATLSGIERRGAEITIGDFHALERESPRQLVLLQGIARGEKMDFVLQKATELGVARIVPVLAARSTVKLDAAGAMRRQAHWQAVAIAACEQCGRNRVPLVTQPLPLAEAVLAEREGLRLLLTAEPQAPPVLQRLAAADAAGLPVVLLVGPEGGLDPDEERVAEFAGFLPGSLGPRVLRTETAALAALAALQAVIGDFAGSGGR